MRYPLISFLLLGSVLLAGLSRPQAGEPQGQTTASPAVTMHYLVLLGVGPNYLSGRPPQEQLGFAEHAAYMSRLAKEGTLVLGGPLLEESGAAGVTGVMLVLTADSETAARSIVEADPLVAARVTEIGEVRRFVVGAASWKPPQACASAGDDSSRNQSTK